MVEGVLKTFEMFAGVGGGVFALKRAGIPHECVGFSEIKPHALTCLKNNHKGIKNFGDCTKIDLNEIPNFDLLTGGFPCQPFSQAGKRKGELDIRGTLFYDIIRVAKHKKPKYLLLENVKGLTYKDMKATFDKILSELDEVGYDVYWKVLNSRDYGTPQSRKRIFFVCFRKDMNINDYEFPQEQELKIFLKDLVIPPSEIDLVSIAKRNKNRSKHQHKGEKYGKYPKEYINQYHKDIGVSYTIKSALHECKVGVIERLDEARCLTPKECFRLMGFFDDEIDLSNLSKNQQYDLAGNGWDINLVSQILKSMIEQ